MDRLDYFKQKLLEILDKKEREERTEIRKSFDFLLDAAIEKSRGYAVGTIREWKGRKFKKMPNSKWVRVYDRRERSAEISIARLKGKVRSAKSVDELFDIVMKNTHRFSDENGKPLDIVLELKAAVEERKKGLNAGKPSTKERIGEFNKKREVEEKKNRALDVFDNSAVPMLRVEYSRDEYNRLFPMGQVETPTGKVKLGEHQFERLGTKDGGARKNLLGAMYQTLHEPTAIIDNIDERGRKAQLYIKSLIDDSKKKATVGVVVDADGTAVSVSFGQRKVNQLRKKIKMASIIRYAADGGRPTTGTDEGTLPSDSPQEENPSSTSSLSQSGEKSSEKKSRKAVKDIKNALEKTRAKGQDHKGDLSNKSTIPQDNAPVKEKFKTWQDVKKAYEGTDKWLKAPNGKDTNLTEKQWCTVRAENFKNWFGDWERAAEINSLANKILRMKSVSAVSGDSFQKDGTPLTDKVTNWYAEKFGGKIARKGFGEIAIDKRAVKDSIAHGIGSLKAAAFMAVPDVLQKGKIIDYQENWKDRNYDTYVISAPITVDDTEYICEAIVTKNARRTGFYLHEVEIKEKAQDVFKTAINGTPQATRLILPRILADVNKSASKIVDENGEPQVVYHGTTGNFDTFEKEHIGDGNYWGKGFYFTTNKEVAERYKEKTVWEGGIQKKVKGTVLDCFVNIKNPYRLKTKQDAVLIEKIVGESGLPKSEIQVDDSWAKYVLGYRAGDQDAVVEKLKKAGYGGLEIFIDPKKKTKFFVSYEPNQIKSATDNDGNFSTGNNSIKKSLRLVVKKSFYDEFFRERKGA